MFRLDSNDFGFIFAGVSNVVSYRRNVWYNLSCVLQIYCRLSITEKLFVSWQFLETYGVINYGSGWRKDVVTSVCSLARTLCIKQDTQDARGLIKTETLTLLFLPLLFP